MSILRNKNAKSVFFASQNDWSSEDENDRGKQNAKSKNKTTTPRAVIPWRGLVESEEKGESCDSHGQAESDDSGRSRPKKSTNKGQRKRDGSVSRKRDKPKRKGRSRSKATRMTKDPSLEDCATPAPAIKSQRQRSKKEQIQLEGKHHETKRGCRTDEPKRNRTPNPKVQQIGCRVGTPLYMGTPSPISPSGSDPKSPDVPIWRALKPWVRQPYTTGDTSKEKREKAKLPFLPAPPPGPPPTTNSRVRMARRSRMAQPVINKETCDDNQSEKSPEKTPSPEDRLAWYKAMKKNMYSLD